MAGPRPSNERHRARARLAGGEVQVPLAQQARSNLTVLATRTTTRQPSCAGAMPATRGFVVAAVVGTPRWHARGQRIELEVLQESRGGKLRVALPVVGVWLTAVAVP
jgi:hypothetical protein